MENKENYKLTRKDFIPLAGWRNYRLRTGEPLLEGQETGNRERILALYNTIIFTTSAIATIKGLEYFLRN